MLGNATINASINTMPRKLSCKLDAGNSNIITDVKRLTYASDWSGSIAVGQVVSSYISVTIPTPTFSIAGVNVALSMGIGTTVTWTEIGDFRIDEESVRTKQGYTGFTAYDKLYYSINTYQSALTFPATLQQVLNEVCGQIGVTSPSLSATENITLQENTLDGYTLRDVLGFIAGYCGKNAYLSPNGVVEFRWFSSASYTADGTRANIPYIGENDCTIRRWICQTQEGTLTSGSGEGLYFTCPFMTQARLDSLAANQQLVAYRKADVDIPFGNYLLQSGDIITVSTTGSNLTVPIMANSWTYDGGVSSSVSSYGATDYTGTANNAERSVSAQRVLRILNEKQAANRVSQAITEATDTITGANGGVMRINMGQDGKPAELLILSNDTPGLTPTIQNATRVFRLNENGLGYAYNSSGNAYAGPYATAITANGLIVTDRFVGNTISGVKVESTQNTTNASQIVLEDGAYKVNDVFNDTVYPVGQIAYKQQTGVYDNDTLAVEVVHGKNFTIGEVGAPKFAFYSDPDPNQGQEMFHFIGNVNMLNNDIIILSLSDSNSSHSLIDIITELQQRVLDLETRLNNANV